MIKEFAENLIENFRENQELPITRSQAIESVIDLMGCTDEMYNQWESFTLDRDISFEEFSVKLNDCLLRIHKQNHMVYFVRFTYFTDSGSGYFKLLFASLSDANTAIEKHKNIWAWRLTEKDGTVPRGPMEHINRTAISKEVEAPRSSQDWVDFINRNVITQKKQRT
tara:strand:- start:29 stop:529 length:501 start_codon:yes stop_codon:yes gene_type:complete